MTEAEWMSCEDLDLLMDFVCARRQEETTIELSVPGDWLTPARWVFPRKRRLFACACCDRVRHLLKPEGLRALDLGYRLADEAIPEDETQAVSQAAALAGRGVSGSAKATLAAAWTCDRFTDKRWAWSLSNYDGGFTAPAHQAVDSLGEPEHVRTLGTLASGPGVGADGDAVHQARQDRKAAERMAQVALFRCIFGNPFRPGRFDPAWLSWSEGTIPNLALAAYAERVFDRLPILADALEDAGCDDTEILGHLRDRGPHARGCWVVDLVLGKE